MARPRAARRRLRAIAEHCVAPRLAAQCPAPAEAASGPLADLDVDGLVESYCRDGYVVVRSFLRADELRRYREELQAYIAEIVPTKRTDEVFFDGEASVEGGRGSLDELKYINHLHERPFFAAFSAEQSAAAHPRWHALAEALTGGEVLCNGCECFNKPPGLSRHTPPHQDNFYFNLKPAGGVTTMWCALDAVDEENGSLSYLPASHAAGLRDHHASWIKGFSQSIKDFGPEDSDAMVEVADLQPGDLVAHHSECIHSARENTSPPERRRTRWAFASVFKRVECVVDEEGQARYQASARSQGSARRADEDD